MSKEKLEKYIKKENEGIEILFNRVRNIIYVFVTISLILSLIMNILSLDKFQTTINNISVSMNSSLESGIQFIKSFSSDYLGVLGFSGSFLVESMAIFVYRLQIKNQKK